MDERHALFDPAWSWFFVHPSSLITHRSSLIAHLSSLHRSSLTRPNQAQTLPHHVRIEDGVLNQLGELLQRKLLLRQDLSPSVSSDTTLCVEKTASVD
jgi:hypothetical protein